MSEALEKFAVQLAANTKSHEDWLAVMRFGRGTLLGHQDLLAEIIATEAARQAGRCEGTTAADHLARILCELGLRITAG